jgi:hypothetical protein
MINEPKVYKNSLGTILLTSFVFLMVIVGIAVGAAVIDLTTMLLLGCFSLVVFPMLFLPMLSKAIVSDDEITAQNLFIPKTVRWTEIRNVSGSGKGIKLHSEDATVSINTQLPGYEEIIETIGEKRPDLFSTQEFGTIRRGVLSYLGTFLGTIAFVAVIILYISTGSSDFVTLLIILGFLGFFLWSFFTEPQVFTFENNNLLIKYLFSEKKIAANEITGIFFTYTHSRRGGKSYYVAINLKEEKQIRVSGLGVSLPVAYLVLKTWHKKFASG